MNDHNEGIDYKEQTQENQIHFNCFRAGLAPTNTLKMPSLNRERKKKKQRWPICCWWLFSATGASHNRKVNVKCFITISHAPSCPWSCILLIESLKLMYFLKCDSTWNTSSTAYRSQISSRCPWKPLLPLLFQHRIIILNSDPLPPGWLHLSRSSPYMQMHFTPINPVAQGMK